MYRLRPAVIIVLGLILEPGFGQLRSGRWRRVPDPGCKFRDIFIDLPAPRRVREVDSLNGPIDAMEEEASLLKSIFELVSELRVEHVASRAIR